MASSLRLVNALILKINGMFCFDCSFEEVSRGMFEYDRSASALCISYPFLLILFEVTWAHRLHVLLYLVVQALLIFFYAHRFSLKFPKSSFVDEQSKDQPNWRICAEIHSVEHYRIKEVKKWQW